MRKALALVALAVMSLAPHARPCGACTTAVVSGKATVDGRPILWKNRDADDLHNQVVYRDDGKYAYLGVVNKGDAAGLEIWAGINSAGFAIMNSASYNLDDVETVAEGAIMKLALQSCRTVADFQRLLEATNATGRDTTANFGVIDGAGGAAYFETGLNAFTRFDANDPAAAPDGWIVRTNFSESGDPALGSGLVRVERARALVGGLAAGRTLSARTLLGTVCRDVANERIGSYPLRGGGPEYAYISDSINRPDTASATVFTGVQAGEDPRLATMWVVLGQPITGVAVPLWVGAGAVPAQLAVGKEPAPLNAAFDRVRALLFPQWRGDLKRYVRVAPLAGVLAALGPLEAANFARADAEHVRWRREPPTPAAQQALQDDIARTTLEAVERALRALTPPVAPAE